MKCTNKEQETCQVEKMGCDGCAYNKKSADEMFAEFDEIEELYEDLTYIEGNVEKTWTKSEKELVIKINELIREINKLKEK